MAAWWRRGGYHIDGGIHFLMGHRPGGVLNDLYRQLGTAAPETLIDMAEYGRFVDEASGKSVLLTADLAQCAAALKNLSPVDAGAVDDLIAGARAFQAAGAFDIGMGEPPELAGRLDTVRQFWSMRKVLRFFTGKYGRTAGEFAADLHDPTLRYLVENLFLPEAPLWFLFMVLGLLASGDMGLLTTGCEGFVPAHRAALPRSGRRDHLRRDRGEDPRVRRQGGGSQTGQRRGSLRRRGHFGGRRPQHHFRDARRALRR